MIIIPESQADQEAVQIREWTVDQKAFKGRWRSGKKNW